MQKVGVQAGKPISGRPRRPKDLVPVRKQRGLEDLIADPFVQASEHIYIYIYIPLKLTQKIHISCRITDHCCFLFVEYRASWNRSTVPGLHIILFNNQCLLFAFVDLLDQGAVDSPSSSNTGFNRTGGHGDSKIARGSLEEDTMPLLQ